MAVPLLIQCEACGRPYSARLVEGEYVLPTDDGKCVCGGETFTTVDDATEPKADPDNKMAP